MIALLFPIFTAVTPLYKHGAFLYEINCQVCHGNPKIGSYGPDIFGSSQALLYNKLVKGGYPAYYTPKRGSHVMPIFPSLEPDIPAITAYLNGPK